MPSTIVTSLRSSSGYYVALSALGLVVLILYGPIVHGHFLFDDLWFIVKNPFMHGPIKWKPLFTDPGVTAAASSGLGTDVYRPLATLWFWIDAHLWGPNTFPYHLENVILHLINGLFLFVLLNRWLRNANGALVGTAVFLLHPVQVQSVAWISQRSSLASTACLFIALLWSGTALIAGAAALLLRETAAVFPFLFAGIEWAQRKRSKIPLGLFVLTMTYLAWRYSVLHQWSQLSGSNTTTGQNLCYGLLAFPVYLGKMLVPIKLRVSYTYPIITLGRVLGATLIGMIYAFCLGRAARRDRWIAAGLFWILMGLVPVLQIVPIRAFVAERFLYVPMIGVAIIAARLAEARVGRALLMMWLIFLTIRTYQAIPAWKTEESLWEEAVRQDPANSFAHICYGLALKDPVDQVREFELALRNPPNQTLHDAAIQNLSQAKKELATKAEPQQ